MSIFIKSENETKPARMEDWLGHMDENPWHAVALGVATFCTVSVIIMAALHLYYVIRYVTNLSLQTDLYWIISLCPIVSICCCVGMFIPRTGAFLYSVGIVYQLFCAFVLVTLMTTLHGSRVAMLEKLTETGHMLNFRVFPYACCFYCIPEIRPTLCLLRVLEGAVFQSSVVRIIMEILNIAVFFELETRTHWFFKVTSIISILSLMASSYASYVLIPAGSKTLKKYRFYWMFRMIDTVQFVYTAQLTALDIIMSIQDIQDYQQDMKEKGHAVSTSQFWACLLGTIEIFIASLMATIFFRPSRTAFFDKHPGSDRTELTPVDPECSIYRFMNRQSPVTSDFSADPLHLKRTPSSVSAARPLGTPLKDEENQHSLPIDNTQTFDSKSGEPQTPKLASN